MCWRCSPRWGSGPRRPHTGLPRSQRDELVAEIAAHVDAGTIAARSEADIRNMLDDLGHPLDIVKAAAPLPAGMGPMGRLAVALGVLALLLTQVSTVLAIPVGVAAVILGLRARRYARQQGRLNRMATSAVALGLLAVALPILLLTVLASSGTDADTEDLTETTILGG
jgi:uncharacterized membrane protein